MLTKVIFIFACIFLQNIFLINSVLSADEYIEVDKIIAVVETRTITKLELNTKKGETKQLLLQQGKDIPSDKEITKLSLEALITEKLVTEYGIMRGINISGEQVNNVMENIAKSNNLSIEEFIKEIERDGSSYSNFRESIRIQLLFDQVKKRIISTNVKISKFEIDNFIELQKERTPTKYNYSHIFIEYIKDGIDIDIEKTKIKLAEVINDLKGKNFLK